MKHIFYIHSNICSIVVFESIKKLLDVRESVVVVTSRNATWTYFLDKVDLYDLSPIHEDYLKNKETLGNNPLSRIWNYETKQRRVLYSFCGDIINGEDFVFYVPHYALIYAKPFLTSKYMKGYYYIEEGVLAYSPLKYLKERHYYPVKFSIQGFLYFIFRINYGFMLKTGRKFMGTIAISEKAFAWNRNNERIVNGLSDFIQTTNDGTVYDAILVSSSIKNEIELNKEVIGKAVRYIYEQKPQAVVGLKFHPSAYSYEKEQCAILTDFIKKELSDYTINILPLDFIIEKEIVANQTDVYSLLQLSSLSLYSVLFAGNAYYFKQENGEIKLIHIPTYEDYFKVINIPLEDK